VSDHSHFRGSGITGERVVRLGLIVIVQVLSALVVLIEEGVSYEVPVESASEVFEFLADKASSSLVPTARVREEEQVVGVLRKPSQFLVLHRRSIV
jgi:hypothetical protein